MPLLLLGWNTATGCDWDVTRTDDTYVRSCPTQVELYWVSTRYIQVDVGWSERLGELVNFFGEYTKIDQCNPVCLDISVKNL